MTTHNWLMQREAIYAAKRCCKLIEQKLGLKLSLAHPAFVTMLGDYASLYDCEEITEAYRQLARYAPSKQARAMVDKIERNELAKRPVSPGRVSVQIRPEQIDSL